MADEGNQIKFYFDSVGIENYLRALLEREMKIPETYQEYLNMILWDLNNNSPTAQTYVKEMSCELYESVIFSSESWINELVKVYNIPRTNRPYIISFLLEKKLKVISPLLRIHKGKRNYLLFLKETFYNFPSDDFNVVQYRQFSKVNIPNELISITLVDPENFKKNCLEDPNFIKKYHKSVCRLYNYKTQRYNDLLKGFCEDNTTYRAPIEKILKLLSQYPKLEEVKKNLKEIFESHEGFKGLVGRRRIKLYVVQFLYAFAENYRTALSFLNMVLLGPPGTGKTKIAQLMGWIFGKAHILCYSDVILATRADIVSNVIGGTAIKVRELFRRGLERPILIDEAYNLFVPHKKDFGEEAVAELVNLLDKLEGLTKVDLAGYEVPTQKLIESNPGLRRRYPLKIILEPYDIETLTAIFLDRLQVQAHLTVTKESANLIYTVLLSQKDSFQNGAGDMTNLVAIMNRIVHSSLNLNWDPNNLQLVNSYLNFSLKVFEVEK